MERISQWAGETPSAAISRPKTRDRGGNVLAEFMLHGADAVYVEP